MILPAILWTLVGWLCIGGLAALICMILERRLSRPKFLINDPMDLLIGIALWPLMLYAIIIPTTPEIKPKKKIKIIVSEDDETEEAFASRCKRL